MLLGPVTLTPLVLPRVGTGSVTDASAPCVNVLEADKAECLYPYHQGLELKLKQNFLLQAARGS